MTSSGIVYLLTTENNALYFSSFDYADGAYSILSPFYSVTFNSGTKQIKGGMSLLSPITSDDALYMSGSLNNKITYFKLRLSDGSGRWAYSVRDTAGASTNVTMSKFDIYMVSSTSLYHVGCAENLGSDTNDLAVLLISETVMVSHSFTKSWFFDSSTSAKLSCLALKAGSTSF